MGKEELGLWEKRDQTDFFLKLKILSSFSNYFSVKIINVIKIKISLIFNN